MPRDESLFPVDQRIFLQTLFGNREPITEADFSQRELDNIVAAVQRNQKRTGATTKGNVGYDDYPSGDEIQPGYAPIESTLGRFNYRMSPLSELQATDRYDFWNDERKANVERYENMPAWKRNVTAPLTSLGYLLSLKPRSAAGELGDAFIGREGRDVKIKIPAKKAKGGAVHMGIGGLLKLKNAVKGAQKVLPAAMDAGKVLPRAEADANKAKFMAESKDPRVMYHGTQADIKKFIPSKGAVFVSPDPKFASKHARQSFIIEDMDDVDSIMQTMSAAEQRKFNKYISSDEFNPEEVSTWLQSNMPKSYANSNVMPLRVQIKNPFDYENPLHIEELKNLARKQFPEDVQVMSYIDQMKNYDHNWPFVENTDIQKLIQQAGHDSFYSSEKGTKNLGIYDPNRIKSDISNRGTYDITDPDISKAKGGAVHFDEGGAAFGVFPQMKARRAQQDRTAAANAPLSALRGWAAGTAGLPGDIEGLARAGISQLPPQLLTAFPALRAFGIGSRADPTPQMPTTEFYNEYLPGAQLNATPTGKAFTVAGNLLGGTGSTTLARYGIKSAKAAGQALGPTAVRIGEEYLQRQGLMPGVIKPKGGNFLSGSVEESVRPMKRGTPSIAFSQEEADDLIARGFVRDKSGGEGYYLPPDPVNNFIDKKIAPYIRNEMATPDDPLRAMAEKYAVDKPVKLAEVQGRIDAFAAKMEQEARDRGVPVEMLTSMRQQMIGLEKEKALLEAREGLHSELFPPNADDIRNLGDVRYAQGFEPGGMGQSEQARIWEDLADVAFDEPAQAGQFGGSRWGEITLQTDPWLRKVPPETPVYGEYLSTGNLGFRHLVDELRNAINPASGLPANLLIDPADLGKFTMPQAVDRVADINAWRATQKIEANQAIANNAATQVVKEYPEQGLKWVELKTPKDAVSTDDGFGNMSTPGYDELEAALKYEGDTMQHCVGGYCQDVVEGKSRIYSLRDTKGQPRVTIEVETTNHLDFNKWWDQQTPQKRLEIDQRAAGNGLQAKLKARIESPEYLADMADLPPSISQIKGFRNKKPADEYLPMVQDFVKSGNWSGVGDLGNTGLIDIQDPHSVLRALGKVSLERNIEQAIQNFNAAVKTAPDAQRYMNINELRDFLGDVAKPEGMAHGGFVSNHFDPIKIKQIIAGLDDEYDPENIQQIIAQRESAYA